MPKRHVTADEALRIADLQAARLLGICNITDGPVPSELLHVVPCVRVVWADLPVSGTSHWSGKDWIITLNTNESYRRQRFTLMHEFKHILDHGRADLLYHDTPRRSAAEQAEQAADYFAGCLLIPRRYLKRDWGNGKQRLAELAQIFEVSQQAIAVRLAQTGLVESRRRCAATPMKQYLPSSPDQPMTLTPARSGT